MTNLSRLNQYRIMWLIVFFDLPTETKRDRKEAGNFRKRLIKDGFNMFQFSIYARHCASRENSKVHMIRVKSFLPPKGEVGILQITDKQFGMMELFRSTKEAEKPQISHQLELF